MNLSQVVRKTKTTTKFQCEKKNRFQSEREREINFLNIEWSQLLKRKYALMLNNFNLS